MSNEIGTQGKVHKGPRPPASPGLRLRSSSLPGSHDPWTEDLGFSPTRAIWGVWSHCKVWLVTPSPEALPYSSLALCCPFSSPSSSSKTATSLYSLPTCAFSAAVGSQGVLSSEPVSELGECLEFRWLHFARETQRWELTSLRSQHEGSREIQPLLHSEACGRGWLSETPPGWGQV